ncbi:hypothetical protein O181_032343 [Austropuccinia psidii MF-1]|uniref:Uncharacterized protein n=1 Tax=Austropuccinia psidii MF-1 TaxID=1389203 RepID=A0A9Q3D1E7_9BASI|nr:hypothetical protein [Austropuccinia psidii MF-1]
MWKRAGYTAFKCIAKAKEYNKQRFDKTHMEPDFKEGNQVLVSTLNFNNLKGPNKMRDSCVGPFTMIKLIGKMQWRLDLQRNSLGNTQYDQSNTWSNSKTRKPIRTNGWKKMPYQMVTFTLEDSEPLGGINSLINDDPFLK